MVPDLPSTGRRGFLAALAAGAAGGTVAVGATAPTALPDVVTDEATKHYPTPPAPDALWRPTVTEAHAREAVEFLAGTVRKGRRLWSRLDTDEPFTGAGGWLESARAALRRGDYHDAHFDARYGMQFAAEQLGTASARLGRADLRGLAARGAALLERVDRVAADLDPYPVGEPARDLARYCHVERALTRAGRRLNWDAGELVRGGADGRAFELPAYEPREVGGLFRRVRRAELAVRTAERFRDRLAADLPADPTAAAGRLEEVATAFEAAIASFPSRDDVLDEVRGDGDGDDDLTPHEFARDRLARWCLDTDYRVYLDGELDARALRAVELSKGLARRRAHGAAVERLVVDPGDAGFDSGHALAEKRRARSAYRAVVGTDPPPLLALQVRRAVEDLRVAKVGFAGSYRRPLWKERLEAYLYALVGRAKLREYPAVYGALTGDG